MKVETVLYIGLWFLSWKSDYYIGSDGVLEYILTQISVYICMYIYIYIYIYMYVYILYVYIICVYIYIYIHISVTRRINLKQASQNK